MRILLCITGLGMGGAEKVVTSLADALAAKGHEVCIAFMTGAAVVLPKNANVQVVSLGMVTKMDAMSAFFKLIRLIRVFRPDVVHSHMIHANIFARLVRLVTPITRLISTAHNSNEGGKLRMIVYRLTDALADISTNVSEEAVAAFVKAKAVRSSRMLAVHNGIATDAFVFNAAARVGIRQDLFVHDNCQLILAVGRLHDAKDYPNLFHALTHLPVNGLTYQMCIAGDGPLRGNLEALAVKLGIADRVRFLGVRSDIPDLMSAADVFVLPSAWEGFGLVVAEAMACERVVVATDCGGVREVLGEAGYLVKTKDSKALAQALQTALQLPAIESATLGRAARQRVIEKYSLDSAVAKWLQLYVT
jgi:glycosyltransferase involved in cell wall biosynthesis